jgi:hypothetical protein
MILVGLFLVLKGIPLFINFPLSEHAWLYIDLLLRFGIEVDFHSIVSLPLFLAFLLLVEVVGVVQLILDFRVEFDSWFHLLGPEYPLWHF